MGTLYVSQRRNIVQLTFEILPTVFWRDTGGGVSRSFQIPPSTVRVLEPSLPWPRLMYLLCITVTLKKEATPLLAKTAWRNRPASMSL
jgi:hypothetical protein